MYSQNKTWVPIQFPGLRGNRQNLESGSSKCDASLHVKVVDAHMTKACPWTVSTQMYMKANLHDLDFDCSTHFLSSKKNGGILSPSFFSLSEIKRNTTPMSVSSTAKHVIRDLQTFSFEHRPGDSLWSLIFVNGISLDITPDSAVCCCTRKVNSRGSA